MTVDSRFEETATKRLRGTGLKTKDLLELAGDPRFISGIYNYCDRWCERCQFTSRCLLYAQERESAGDTEANDIHNEALPAGADEIEAGPLSVSLYSLALR